MPQSTTFSGWEKAPNSSSRVLALDCRGLDPEGYGEQQGRFFVTLNAHAVEFDQEAEAKTSASDGC